MAGIRATITMEEKFRKEIVDMSIKEKRSFSQQMVYLAAKGKELVETQTGKNKD